MENWRKIALCLILHSQSFIPKFATDLCKDCRDNKCLTSFVEVDVAKGFFLTEI